MILHPTIGAVAALRPGYIAGSILPLSGVRLVASGGTGTRSIALEIHLFD